MAVGSLTIELEARLAKLEEGLKQATRMIDSQTTRMSEGFDGLQSVAKRVGAAIGGYFSARLFVDMIKGAIDAQDRLQELAKRAQVTVTAIGGIGYAASLAGVNIEEATTQLGRLNVSIGQALSGDKAKYGLFSAMNIELVDKFTGKAKDASVVLADLADRFASYEDGPRKAALGQAIFGRAYQTLLPLLEQGGAELRKQIEYYKTYSGVTEESAAAADRLNDEFTKLHLLQQNFANSLANKFVPTLMELAKEFVNTREKSGLLVPVVDAMSDAFQGTAVVITGLISLFKQVLVWIEAAAQGVAQIVIMAGKADEAAKAARASDRPWWERFLDPAGSKAAYDSIKNQGTQAFKDIAKEAQAASDKILKNQQTLNRAIRGDWASMEGLDHSHTEKLLAQKKTAPNVPGGGKAAISEAQKLIDTLTKQVQAEIDAANHATELDKVLTAFATNPELQKGPQAIRDRIAGLAMVLDQVKANTAVEKLTDSFKSQMLAAKTSSDQLTAVQKAEIMLANDETLIKATEARREAFLEAAKALGLYTDKVNVAISAETEARRADKASYQPGDFSADIGMRQEDKRLQIEKDVADFRALQAQTVEAKLNEQLRLEALVRKNLSDMSGNILPENQARWEELLNIIHNGGKQIKETVDAMSKFAEQASKNIQNSLGVTLRTMLDGDFKSIGEMWKNLIKDMIAQAAAAELNEKLFGTDPKNPFMGGLIGAMFGFSGVGGKAGGGYVQPGSLTRINEAGAETFTVQGRDYLLSGKGGRVNRAQGGTWGGNVIVNVGAGVQRSEIVALVPMLKSELKGEIMAAMRRPGSPYLAAN